LPQLFYSHFKSSKPQNPKTPKPQKKEKNIIKVRIF